MSGRECVNPGLWTHAAFPTVGPWAERASKFINAAFLIIRNVAINVFDFTESSPGCNGRWTTFALVLLERHYRRVTRQLRWISWGTFLVANQLDFEVGEEWPSTADGLDRSYEMAF